MAEAAQMVNEGTWAFNKMLAPKIIDELKDIKKRAYKIIGDDEFYDGLDSAIKRASLLLKNDHPGKGIDVDPNLAK